MIRRPNFEAILQFLKNHISFIIVFPFLHNLQLPTWIFFEKYEECWPQPVCLDWAIFGKHQFLGKNCCGYLLLLYLWSIL